MQLKISNNTHNIRQPGHFLDAGNNRLFGAGKSIVIDAEAANKLPEPFAGWQAKQWIAVHAVEDTSVVAAPGDITPGSLSPVSEVSQSESDLDEIPDTKDAVEANTDAAIMQAEGGHLVDNSQSANVSLGESPIPGEKVRSVDDSGDFTVKAPRS
jgi:hypothetical protein